MNDTKNMWQSGIISWRWMLLLIILFSFFIFLPPSAGQPEVVAQIQYELADTPWPMYRHDPQRTGQS